MVGTDLSAIDAPECPPQFAYLLAWWGELSATRSAGLAGPAPISYLEVEAWARLTGRAPSIRQVGLLRAIDNAYLRSVADG